MPLFTNIIGINPFFLGINPLILRINGQVFVIFFTTFLQPINNGTGTDGL